MSIFRPTYRAGPFEVVCKRWWSRSDRKAARLGAKVIAYEWERTGHVGYPHFARSIEVRWPNPMS